MDPNIIALALAIQSAAPFVIQKLIEKGLIEPGVKLPDIDSLGHYGRLVRSTYKRTATTRKPMWS